MKAKRLFAGLLIIVVSATAVWILAYSQVETAVTKEDVGYLKKILGDDFKCRNAAQACYREQIRTIRSIQRAVLRVAGVHEKIPLNQTREPADLWRRGHGYCFDRSRTIEKALRHCGFQVRHVGLWVTDTSGGASVRALLTPGVGSHSLSEVLTKKGWLVADSNSAWISLGRDDRPVPMSAIQVCAETSGNCPVFLNPSKMPGILRRPFVFLYGVYSRHGRFYPPYNAAPDINWTEFALNIPGVGFTEH